MKHLKYFMFVFLFFEEIQELKCQLPVEEDYKAHRRYWFYRTRLINDFMKIGKEQGDCIIFTQRNQEGSWSPGANMNTAKVGADQIDITNQYLTALALEYKLLSRSNQNTDETVKEIFHLLHAINRLDAEAEQFWSSPPPPANQNILPNYSSDLQGFALREDMPRNYITNNFNHFNYSKNEDQTNVSGFTGIEKVEGLCWDNPFNNWEGFDLANASALAINARTPTSRIIWGHDKLYSMFVAFMFLNKYLPDGLQYFENGQPQFFQDNVSDIKTEIRSITDRMYKWVRGEVFSPTAIMWEPKYPNGDWLSLNHLGTAKPFCYALAKMASYINPSNALYYCDQYALNIGYASYQSAQVGIPGWQHHLDLAPWLFINYGADEDVIENASGKLESNDMAVFLADCQVGTNEPLPIPEWLHMLNNIGTYNLQWSGLMRKVLHEDGQLGMPLSVFSAPISTAPCNGPYNFKSGQYPHLDWSCQDRLEHADKMGALEGIPHGRYPGVDYMLLHNLYYEYLNQLADASEPDGERNYAYNLMDNYDEQIWPRNTHTESYMTNNSTDILEGVNETGNSTTITYGPPPGNQPHTNTTFKMPANVKVFQYLSSRAQIYATSSPAAPNNIIPSQVNYRAGKEIKLLPGFEVKSGASFNAYIQRYLCSSVSDYGSGMRTKDSLNIRSYDYESDLINAYAPIHNVYYPKVSDKNSLVSNTLLRGGESKKELIRLFPNPSTGKYMLESFSADRFDVKVFTIHGVIINENSFEGTKQEINIENHSPGVYFMEVKSSSGDTQTLKLIKQ